MSKIKEFIKNSTDEETKILYAKERDYFVPVFFVRGNRFRKVITYGRLGARIIVKIILFPFTNKGFIYSIGAEVLMGTEIVGLKIDNKIRPCTLESLEKSIMHYLNKG